MADDAMHDAFQREPYEQRARTLEGNFIFVQVTVHTHPDAAVGETGALEAVLLDAPAQYPGEDDVLVLGDFKTSCSYASTAELDGLAFLSDEYTWILPDDADTTVSDRIHCAYDRSVVRQGVLEDFTETWEIDQAFTDNAVSDHWPVVSVRLTTL